MNFHVFVIVSTSIFYILLRMYKTSVTEHAQQDPQQRKSSNLVYVLFLPAIMYLYHFMYVQSPTPTTPTQIPTPTLPNPPNIIPQAVADNLTNVSDSLLSSPFPETTISSSSTSNT